MGDLQTIIRDLKSHATKEKAAFLPYFFKTGKGEYAEGDRFHGIIVPDQRKIAKLHAPTIKKETIIALLDSPFHEERMTALFILCNKFQQDKKIKKEKQWVDLYLKKADRVNNWDLVDNTAHIILGQWLEDKDRSILYRLAKNKSLWKNRIAVVATLHFIRKKDFHDILQLSQIMLKHSHDLMHKATGWMLREAWKRDAKTIEQFLNKFAHQMPRTMLRYAIERIPEPKRKAYLSIKFQSH
ncbi:MAG: DNA alkylation repair protein [Bacteroidota bacterium]|jgi:3-methyladenine DNA glycosylase AlkD